VREARRAAQAAAEAADPGMEGIRLALAALESRRRQLYNPYSFVPESDQNPAMRELEDRQREAETRAVDREVERYKADILATAARGEGASVPLG